VRLKAKLNLESFVNSCQDDAGIDLIKEAGALELVNAGDLEHAIWLCSNVWASLPGSRAGQQIRPMQMLIDAYQGAGGALA
jgi:muramidase (phage lysozyme)